MTPDERIAELEGLVRQQRQQLEVVLAQNAVLQARVQELEARLAKDTYTAKTAQGMRLYSADREGHRE